MHAILTQGTKGDLNVDVTLDNTFEHVRNCATFKETQTRLCENIELFYKLQKLWEVENFALITYISPHQGHTSLHN